MWVGIRKNYKIMKKKLKKNKIKKNKNNIKKEKKKFLLQTKEIFLTYSQSGKLELEFVINTLLIKLNIWAIKDFLLSKELHEDGNPHIHVYLKTLRRTHIENPSYFDIEFEENIFHPNIQPARKVVNVINYILKFVKSKYDENLYFSNSMSSRIDDRAEFMPLSIAAMALAENGQIEKALNLYRQEKPDFFLKNHLSLEKALRSLYVKARGCVAKFDMGKFHIPESLKNGFVEFEIGFQNKNPKSLYLQGSPGTGKSRVIEAYVVKTLKLNPLTINDINSIRNFTEGIHTAIIFDDVNLSKVSEEELIKLLDSEQESTFRVTHGSISIPAYTPRFFSSNKELKDCVNFKLTQAMTRRVIHITIGDTKLFQLLNDDTVPEWS